MRVNKLKKILKEAENKAYLYIHKNIRPLPKTAEGNWDFKTGEFINNDVDAFRHAYVSGILTQLFNVAAANILGQIKELEGDMKRNQPKEQKNMDLWNNKIGREYGKVSRNKNELAKLIQEALEKGELIISVDQEKDSRQYEEDNYSSLIDYDKPIIVVEENETGRNEWFLDLVKGNLLTRNQFVLEIESGNYPGYLVADINNLSTPMSKPDGVTENNLR